MFNELTPLKIMFDGLVARFNELRKVENRETGASTVEFVLIVGGIAVIVLAALAIFKVKILDAANNINVSPNQ
ncbi:Flp family type IVb pilin [Catenulispora rubra]|uniref:Flp family type IVb pilin n=1 Tax=Catenulispora rubra TaxID=280293 RepID=UPI00189269CA|nr:hypothetical protein [Catenulispora rubra]